jgi:SAM-dependent methyltransferase
MGEAFQRLYFDLVYNPVYDLTTATLGRYHALQSRCLDLLELCGGERLLCVGLGTGNEIAAAAGRARGLRIAGVDLSPSAIRRARAKARACGLTADLRIMDARALAFADGSFDRVLCLHVMDFVDNVGAAVSEITRVLSPGGRFVLTLPSETEDAALGASLLGNQVRTLLRSGKSALRVTLEMLLVVPVGLLYLPLLARPGQRAFSRAAAAALFDGRVADLAIEAEPVYKDLIVSGRRT